ncbi:uncharacterized protein B0I36DRAFT_351699 [Microdochium trichocladiopsis]|uniref:Uncharacterized protein n=1 Tax=Microdochium trichocladiopsis TaxID=1682393 RepID=A0A9P9BLY4_9PEZI|nr:uncharacterized protein B0I36DRAFT_351699 [Microdochium trichocladiopsis]KAH7025723.1 hypothetical protein B0I36DRAFT_351699 [Microdochium trichocladiopsis]
MSHVEARWIANSLDSLEQQAFSTTRGSRSSWDVGDLSLLEKLLSQYQDQPVQLNFVATCRTEATARCPSQASGSELCQQVERHSEIDPDRGDDMEGDEGYQTQHMLASPPKIPVRFSSLSKIQREQRRAQFSPSPPSLPNAMLQAAILGRQIDIVDYLITEFRWFLSIDDAIMHAVLLAGDLGTLRILYSHYPRIINYRFQAMPKSAAIDLSYVRPAPVRGPTVSILEQVMSRGHLGLAYHDFALFLVEHGATMDTEGSTSHGTMYQAIQTRQPLSVVQACLKRGMARICMASIELAVQNNDHETLHLMFASSRPTRDEVSDREILRLAVPFTDTAEQGERPSCSRMLREYVLARQIHSRTQAKRRRMSSCRPISVLSTASQGYSIFPALAELECPMEAADDLIATPMLDCSDGLPRTRPPSYTSFVSQPRETSSPSPPYKAVPEHSWFRRRCRSRGTCCARMELPRLLSASAQAFRTWYEETSPLLECPEEEEDVNTAGEKTTSSSSKNNNNDKHAHDTHESHGNWAIRPTQESLATTTWDKGKMASSTTVHTVQHQMKRTRRLIPPNDSTSLHSSDYSAKRFSL